MADKQVLKQAMVALVENNMKDAKTLFQKFISEARVEIIAQKLQESVEDKDTEEKLPTDDEVAELKDEIAFEEPTEEVDLDVEEVPAEGDEVVDVEATEETVPVVTVDDAEEALADSGEEVGIEEDEDFLALVDEYSKALEATSVEVPAEEVAVEEVPAEGDEVVADVEEPIEGEEVSIEEPVEEVPAEEVVEEKPAEKQEEIDIEKFVK